jgi:hypothetical protein
VPFTSVAAASTNVTVGAVAVPAEVYPTPGVVLRAMLYEAAPATAVQVRVTCLLPAVGVTVVGATNVQTATGLVDTWAEGADRQVPLLELTT